jgi:hypothetical protein
VCVQTLLVFEGVCIRAYVSGRVHRGVCTVGAGIENTYIEATCIEDAGIRVRIQRNNVIRHCVEIET